MDNKDNKEPKGTTDNNSLKPDPATLHTTDPQKNMEGPVSSSLKGLGDTFNTNETKEEADEERERHM